MNELEIKDLTIHYITRSGTVRAVNNLSALALVCQKVSLHSLRSDGAVPYCGERRFTFFPD